MRFALCRMALLSTLLAAVSLPARAAIHNLGVDIGTDGTQTVLPFFDESSIGNEVDGSGFFLFFFIPGETLTITVDAASVFGPGPVVAAELFIDAFDVGFNNSSVVRIQGDVVGSLANTSSPSDIPVEAGPVGTHVTNSSLDVDNTFFDLSPYLTDLATDPTFTIEIQNTTLGIFTFGEEIRIDGINIQAETLPPIDPGGNLDLPEPGSLLVWSVVFAFGSTLTTRRRVLAAS